MDCVEEVKIIETGDGEYILFLVSEETAHFIAALEADGTCTWLRRVCTDWEIFSVIGRTEEEVGEFIQTLMKEIETKQILEF